jgi:hypothetical protein
MEEVYVKLEDAALYIEHNPALVKSITLQQFSFWLGARPL